MPSSALLFVPIPSKSLQQPEPTPTPAHSTHVTPQDPLIPQSLQRQLQSAYRSPDFPGIPADFDQDMLAMSAKVAAGAAARRKNSHRRFRKNLLTGLAAALAAGTITAWFAWPRTAPLQSTTLATTNPRDLNSDGRVDMIDALLLAELAGTGTAPNTLDLNADGRVNTADAHALAADAVNLSRGTL